MVRARDGDLYKVVRIHGRVFELRYGYYAEFERETEEPIPIYPDFRQEPQYTDEGYPFVTQMQALCEHGESRFAEGCCADCRHYRDGEELIGICTCTHAARCACGKEQGEPTAHTFDNDCDAVCNACGEQARAEIFHTDKDGEPCLVCGETIEKKPISGGAVSGIVTGSAVVLGGGGFSLFWFVIKKKSLAELLGLLIG